jgi:hypothetical protein
MEPYLREDYTPSSRGAYVRYKIISLLRLFDNVTYLGPPLISTYYLYNYTFSDLF